MPRPVTLTFDLLTLKSVCESHVTWGILVQSFVFLSLLVFELEPMYATSDRQTDDGRRSPLNAPPPTGRGHNNALRDLILLYKDGVYRKPSRQLKLFY